MSESEGMSGSRVAAKKRQRMPLFILAVIMVNS